MSKEKKPKKARRPNIPLDVDPGMARAGGLEATASVAAPRARETATINFDYSQTKSDLIRIGTLAVGFIVVLVVLSFIIQ